MESLAGLLEKVEEDSTGKDRGRGRDMGQVVVDLVVVAEFEDLLPLEIEFRFRRVDSHLDRQ